MLTVKEPGRIWAHSMVMAHRDDKVYLASLISYWRTQANIIHRDNKKLHRRGLANAGALSREMVLYCK